MVGEIHFDKGNKDKVEIVPKYDLSILENKNSSDHKYNYKTDINSSIKLPIKKGSTVGKIHVYEKNKKITSVDLVSNTSVDKLNFIELYIETVKNSILGLIN